jgi:aminoglycoside phosphotransferase family enzyme/predicted kinase
MNPPTSLEQSESVEHLLVRHLACGKGFPGNAVLEHHITTHASQVFICADGNVYKLKRWVYYGFLDYRTLEQRKLACEEELKRNRRTAPSLYRQVLPVRCANDEYTIGGAGTIVDYALCMRTFDRGSLFSELLTAGHLTREHIVSVARSIAAFHEDAEPRPSPDYPEFLRGAIRENCTVLGDGRLSAGGRSQVARILELSETRFLRVQSLLEERSTRTLRLLHGDLHLGNICLVNGVPTLFDGIEFNDAYAVNDPMLDFAFLTMDLTARRRPDLAARALNTYLEAGDDFSGLPLLPLAESYRAMIRAKIEYLRLCADGLALDAEHEAEIIRYLEIAEQALVKRSARIILVGGLSGSGKSVLSAHLGECLNAVVVSSDAVRKHSHGISPYERGAPEIYTEAATERTYREVLKRALATSAEGFTVVCDATFCNHETRKHFEETISAHHIPWFGFWCLVPEEEAVRRISARRKMVQQTSDATEEIFKAQMRSASKPDGWSELDTRTNPGELALELKNRINRG